jgi:hypothetical protein
MPSILAILSSSTGVPKNTGACGKFEFPEHAPGADDTLDALAL